MQPDPQMEAQANPAEMLEAIVSSQNIAAELDDDKLREIGSKVVRDFDADKASMDDWLGKMQKAIDLAKLVKDDKSYPFTGASNIKYPLVASAALQFNARAYPAIVPSDAVVKCKVWGEDKRGMKAARAERVGAYMSWQLSVEIEEWEADTDKLLVQLPIVGDMFRKVWFDGERGRCRLVEPGKFILNNRGQSLALLPRCSEEMELFPYEITERELDRRFVKVEYPDQGEDDDQKPECFIEQHCRIDLDEDGYSEPYVVTVHRESESVVRLVADFTMDDVSFVVEQQQVPQVVDGPYGPQMVLGVKEVPTSVKKIKRGSYFVHYQFMPGMGDGILGTGLGILLGDISAAINTSFNMLIDAGHYASLGGGFIGSDFRLKGGAQRMRPGEWAKVASTGDDVRKSIVPMTFPGPDQTLFAMLGMLIDAGKEIASIQDVLTGDTGGRVQTATTTMALIEQGLKVFTASYKRIFRALKSEFRMFADINARSVSPEQYNAFLDDTQQGPDGQEIPVQHDPAADFGAKDMDVQPVSDPNAVTKMQEMAKAQLLMELAEKQMLNPMEAVQRILSAASVDDIEKLLPTPDPVQMQKQQMVESLQFEGLQAGLAQQSADIELTLAKVDEARANATAKMAGIELDEKKLQLDAISQMLKDRQDGIKNALTAATGRMAGASGNGGASPRA